MHFSIFSLKLPFKSSEEKVPAYYSVIEVPNTTTVNNRLLFLKNRCGPYNLGLEVLQSRLLLQKETVHTAEEEKAQVLQVSLASSSLEQKVLLSDFDHRGREHKLLHEIPKQTFSCEPHFCVLRVIQGMVATVCQGFIVFGRCRVSLLSFGLYNLKVCGKKYISLKHFG